MSNTDFGSAFSETLSTPCSEDEPLRITLNDVEQLERARSRAIERAGPMRIEVVSPQRLASERYGVLLPAPRRGEELFVGVVRNPNLRIEEKESWSFLSWILLALARIPLLYPHRRQFQVFTFEVEVTDYEGNPIEYVPVEVRGRQISGVLPGNGTPVAVYGSRDPRDRVVRTHKVINLRTRSSITIL